MSKYKTEFETFFGSPAGISLLTWLQEQRTTEHEKGEKTPDQAGYYSQAARAYGEVLQHISTAQTGVIKTSRYSDKTDA